MQSLKELLRDAEAFSVDRDDEDEDVVWISYNDLLANEYADRVKESIAVLGALEGVDEAWHEDREVVAVRGTSLSLTPIETALRKFWSGVPRLPARWAEETKIVERALVQILKPQRFRKRGLIWNRMTAGGLVHVVDLYRTNYENHVRPGILLTVGVHYRKATTVGLSLTRAPGRPRPVVRRSRLSAHLGADQ